jgi:hypothetical protein
LSVIAAAYEHTVRLICAHIVLLQVTLAVLHNSRVRAAAIK